MNTLILPGFSIKNKDWAEEIKKQIGGVSEVSVVNWSHWETGQSEENWIEKEADKIIREAGEEKVNILAKSIGTIVAMIVLQKKLELVNRLILCGVPINDFLPGNENYYEVLRNFPTENILCIQNLEDNHGSYEQAEKFVHSFNPAITILSKERQDHDYPYAENFVGFLSK